MKHTQTALMAYGMNSAAASEISKNYTLTQLRRCDMNHLLHLGISADIAERLLSTGRTPIPQKIADEILRMSAFTCCICKQPGLPVVIHHIDKWEQSHSHDLENLSVLCLNHHGEAHTHHEVSRNLTPENIREAQKDWFEIVEQRGNQEQDDALGNVQRYQGRWDHFNISYIYGLLSDYNISFSSRYKQNLFKKNLIDENGDIRSEKLTMSSTHWLDFFDGNYIKLYVEEMVNTIINTLHIKYLSGSIYTQKSIEAGDLCLIDGDFYFKRLNKRVCGTGQMRRATCIVGDMKFVGEFDAWYCNTSTSHGTHLTGHKTATQLCLVRNIDNDDGVEQIHCTIIGLGLSLTKPDLMSQLMGSFGRTLNVQTNQTHEHELDQIADLKRGKEYDQHFLPPPERCDICKTSLENKKYMIDGEMKNRSMWAIMCPDCYHVHGNGIGWGSGQLYYHQDGQWLMVGGFSDSVEDEMDEEILLELFDNFIGNSEEID